ncbi:hypothetical protein KIPB_003166 [Kipferlia bialata]|uniref:Uncharacterized protein n=1 Tax=Kipferlia bialata TaxID=797122 RepID=A0A9K3CTH9_9EUKA|nr:hypothetical protein KIPB_003166 [Kipferlia bialata]|eukprot:g3166.t1
MSDLGAALYNACSNLLAHPRLNPVSLGEGVGKTWKTALRANKADAGDLCGALERVMYHALRQTELTKAQATRIVSLCVSVRDASGVGVDLETQEAADPTTDVLTLCVVHDMGATPWKVRQRACEMAALLSPSVYLGAAIEIRAEDKVQGVRCAAVVSIATWGTLPHVTDGGSPSSAEEALQLCLIVLRQAKTAPKATLLKVLRVMPTGGVRLSVTLDSAVAPSSEIRAAAFRALPKALGTLPQGHVSRDHLADLAANLGQGMASPDAQVREATTECVESLVSMIGPEVEGEESGDDRTLAETGTHSLLLDVLRQSVNPKAYPCLSPPHVIATADRRRLSLLSTFHAMGGTARGLVLSLAKDALTYISNTARTLLETGGDAKVEVAQQGEAKSTLLPPCHVFAALRVCMEGGGDGIDLVMADTLCVLCHVTRDRQMQRSSDLCGAHDALVACACLPPYDLDSAAVSLCLKDMGHSLCGHAAPHAVTLGRGGMALAANVGMGDMFVDIVTDTIRDKRVSPCVSLVMRVVCDIPGTEGPASEDALLDTAHYLVGAVQKGAIDTYVAATCGALFLHSRRVCPEMEATTSLINLLRLSRVGAGYIAQAVIAVVLTAGPTVQDGVCSIGGEAGRGIWFDTVTPLTVRLARTVVRELGVADAHSIEATCLPSLIASISTACVGACAAMCTSVSATMPIEDLEDIRSIIAVTIQCLATLDACLRVQPHASWPELAGCRGYLAAALSEIVLLLRATGVPSIISVACHVILTPLYLFNKANIPLPMRYVSAAGSVVSGFGKVGLAVGVLTELDTGGKDYTVGRQNSLSLVSALSPPEDLVAETAACHTKTKTEEGVEGDDAPEADVATSGVYKDRIYSASLHQCSMGLAALAADVQRAAKTEAIRKEVGALSALWSEAARQTEAPRGDKAAPVPLSEETGDFQVCEIVDLETMQDLETYESVIKQLRKRQ